MIFVLYMIYSNKFTHDLIYFNSFLLLFNLIILCMQFFKYQIFDIIFTLNKFKELRLRTLYYYNFHLYTQIGLPSHRVI